VNISPEWKRTSFRDSAPCADEEFKRKEFHEEELSNPIHPRWLLQRKRPTTKDRFDKCFVFLPLVRALQSRNDEGFKFFRISLMTWPGSNPNWSRIASNVVRSSQAI
jgi:hypothetical protein